MFVLAKIFSWLLAPGNVLFGCACAGAGLLWTRWWRWGRGVLVACLGILLAVAVLPVGAALTSILEDRFPAPERIDGPVHGVVVLGGAISPVITESRGQIALGEGAERLIEFVRLARRFPGARLLYSGGPHLLRRPDLREAHMARYVFVTLGLDAGRVMFEDESRTIFESARQSTIVAKPAPAERWILIASAHHMPRAVGAFRRFGWNVIPWPVDYRVPGRLAQAFDPDVLGGLASLNTAAEEWYALVTYRVFGRSVALFPGP